MILRPAKRLEPGMSVRLAASLELPAGEYRVAEVLHDRDRVVIRLVGRLDNPETAGAGATLVFFPDDLLEMGSCL
jgi:hypothetical protein